MIVTRHPFITGEVDFAAINFDLVVGVGKDLDVRLALLILVAKRTS